MQLQNCDGRDYMGKKMLKPLSESAFYQWKSFDYTYFWINDARPEPTAKDLITYSWMCVASAFKKTNKKKTAINLPLILCDLFTRWPCHVTIIIPARRSNAKNMQLFLCLSTILILRQARERERERESNTSQLHHSATRWPGEEEHNGFWLIKGIIPKSVFFFFFQLLGSGVFFCYNFWKQEFKKTLL